MNDPDNPNNQPDDLERHARSIVGLIGDDRQDKALLDRVHHLISHGSHSHEYIRERIYLAELIALDRIGSALEAIGDLLESAKLEANKR